MKAIKKNLKDQILTNDKRLSYCSICGNEGSANVGDKWDTQDNYKFKCCGITMELVIKKIVYIK